MKLRRKPKPCAHQFGNDGYCVMCRFASPDKSVYNPRRMRWERLDGTPVDQHNHRRQRQNGASSQRMCGGVLTLYKSMPWGRYMGEYLVDIPEDYLEWVLANLTDDGSGLWQSIEIELNERANGPECELLNREEHERFDL